MATGKLISDGQTWREVLQKYLICLEDIHSSWKSLKETENVGDAETVLSLSTVGLLTAATTTGSLSGH